MNYYQQDILFVVASLALALCLVIYSFGKRRLPQGFGLLLSLVLLLSTGGLADMVFRWNPHPSLVLLADSFNVLCFALVLTIMLHYSALFLNRNNPWLSGWVSLLLYLPAVLVALAYTASPWMVRSITASPIGFKINYNPGYWTIVILGLLCAAACFLINLEILLQSKQPGEKNRSWFVLFVLLLIVYFYGSTLLLPFLFHTVNFASPLPTTCAVFMLIYAYIRYGYFALSKIR